MGLVRPLHAVERALDHLVIIAHHSSYQIRLPQRREFLDLVVGRDG